MPSFDSLKISFAVLNGVIKNALSQIFAWDLRYKWNPASNLFTKSEIIVSWSDEAWLEDTEALESHGDHSFLNLTLCFHIKEQWFAIRTTWCKQSIIPNLQLFGESSKVQWVLVVDLDKVFFSSSNSGAESANKCIIPSEWTLQMCKIIIIWADQILHFLSFGRDEITFLPLWNLLSDKQWDLTNWRVIKSPSYNFLANGASSTNKCYFILLTFHIKL